MEPCHHLPPPPAPSHLELLPSPCPWESQAEVSNLLLGNLFSQNLKMLPLPERAHGNFFEECCYVILHVSHLGVFLRGNIAQSC